MMLVTSAVDEANGGCKLLPLIVKPRKTPSDDLMTQKV